MPMQAMFRMGISKFFDSGIDLMKTSPIYIRRFKLLIASGT